MSDFWARRLGAPTPQPQQAPQTVPQQPAAASTAPWWAPSGWGRTEPVPAAPVSYQQAPETNAYGGTEEGSAKKAPSARKTDTCPECGSGNYLVDSQGRARPCFDCGYPIVQSGSGGGGLPAGQGGPATPTRQTADGGRVRNNYHPETIVAKV